MQTRKEPGAKKKAGEKPISTKVAKPALTKPTVNATRQQTAAKTRSNKLKIVEKEGNVTSKVNVYKKC